MTPASAPEFHVAAGHQPAVREIRLDAEAVFDHPLVRAWRHLPDRENCTLDADLADGSHVRWHVKRYTQPRRHGPADAGAEVQGFQLLIQHNIPTAPLVGWGRLPDGRSFVISQDLTGYTPSDKLIEGGLPFDRLLAPTAKLAADLHNAGLHHRDLYLCHFMAKADGADLDLKLIDVARVRPLPRLFSRTRWVVKDLAQFWYSTTKLPIADDQRRAWLDRYAEFRGMSGTSLLRRRIERKSNAIARHDRKLTAAHPGRNISIPQRT